MSRFVMASLLVVLFALNSNCAYGGLLDDNYVDVRLIDAGVGVAGDDQALLLGVECSIKEGWNIYWKDPGDVGLATRIDATVSNGDLDRMHWPKHMKEYFSYNGTKFQSNVYKNYVVFPLRIKIKDSEAPVETALVVNYAICSKDMCIPQTQTISTTHQRDTKISPQDRQLVLEWLKR